MLIAYSTVFCKMLSLVQYSFCRTKTSANKIQYSTKHCRMTFLLYIRISDFQSHLDRHTTKTVRWTMHTLKTPISLGISTQYDQSSQSALRNLERTAKTDQTGWMPSWSESSLDAQVVTVWLLFSFNAHKISFLRFRWHVQLFRINQEEVMIMKKQRQWRGKHNAKKIKHCDRHYFCVQHYWFSRAARSVALKWTKFCAFYNGYWLNTAIYFVSGR